MDWNNFSESTKESPDVTIKNFISGFPKATNELLTLKVKEVAEVQQQLTYLGTSFQYELYLYSPYVDGYSFRIMFFGFNVELLEIRVVLDGTIHEEIFNTRQPFGKPVSMKNDTKFPEFLEKVFSSNRFKEVVSGLLTIAKKNKR